MPAPQAQMMKMLAKTKFSSNSLKVPDKWQAPSGNDAKQHYGMAFKQSDKMSSPDTMVPPLFLPHTMHKSHTDVQKGLNKNFGEFIDKVCDAICSAWSNTQSLASLVGVLINGLTATAGQVIWPPMGTLILAKAWKPSELKYVQPLAAVIDTQWASYIATMKVPGLPWYPAFMASPSPVAIPSPNVPMPVGSLTQVATLVSANVMKPLMIAQFATPDAQYHKELFEAFCDAFEKCHTAWLGTCLVTNVIGTGPVPTMTSPVPVPGPVVAGFGAMPPGGFK